MRAYSRRARKSVTTPRGSMATAASVINTMLTMPCERFHCGLLQTTVCIARFSRLSNSSSGSSSICPTK